MANDREFRAMLSAVAAGRLRPRVDQVLPLVKAADAYKRLEQGEQFGKIVLSIQGE